MIGKLTGTLSGRQGDAVVVDVGGVGYCVRVPLGHPLTDGSAVSLFIHTAVRDDAIDLYGFPQEGDLAFFRQLMSVSGVGPKTALSIMGVSDSQALKRAIAGGDASVLHKVFGIGKKSAERIVVELRDKVGAAAGEAQGPDGEVLEALTALGYTLSEARAALKRAQGESMQEKLSGALRELGRINA
jgi:holliday junction DNA helicase RuvA